jgi:DNA polymerase III subunit delta'
MARIIDSVVGHKTEIARLFHMKEIQRWPHAMLFVGPSGTGKKKIAMGMAQALVCEQSLDGCGVCAACLRIEKKQSESLTLIEPDAEMARPAIKVEQIRDLLDSLSLASIGSARVVIIDQANTMNAQASNALLKTLEEPTENIFFILIANDVHQFLPTIRSRTQAIRFSTLSYEELKLIKPSLPDWTYRSSRGQLDRLQLLSSVDGASQRDEALTFLEQFCQDEHFLTDKSWKDAVKDRSWALFSINCWLLMARDAILLKNQVQKFILNTDQSERLKQLYSVSSSKLLWLAQRLVFAEKDINSNADPVLVFENLWIQYARVD